jgi:hypothetical protein
VVIVERAGNGSNELSVVLGQGGANLGASTGRLQARRRGSRSGLRRGKSSGSLARVDTTSVARQAVRIGAVGKGDS